jgi:hypothetical protein
MTFGDCYRMKCLSYRELTSTILIEYIPVRGTSGKILFSTEESMSKRIVSKYSMMWAATSAPSPYLGLRGVKSSPF